MKEHTQKSTYCISQIITYGGGKSKQRLPPAGDGRVDWRLIGKEHEGTFCGDGRVPHFVRVWIAEACTYLSEP